MLNSVEQEKSFITSGPGDLAPTCEMTLNMTAADDVLGGDFVLSFITGCLG